MRSYKAVWVGVSKGDGDDIALTVGGAHIV